MINWVLQFETELLINKNMAILFFRKCVHMLYFIVCDNKIEEGNNGHQPSHGSPSTFWVCLNPLLNEIFSSSRHQLLKAWIKISDGNGFASAQPTYPLDSCCNYILYCLNMDMDPFTLRLMQYNNLIYTTHNLSLSLTD